MTDWTQETSVNDTEAVLINITEFPLQDKTSLLTVITRIKDKLIKVRRKICSNVKKKVNLSIIRFYVFEHINNDLVR